MAKTVKKDETPVKAVEAVKTPAAVEETKAVKEEVKTAPKAAKTAPKAAKAAAKTTKTAKATKEKKAAKPKAAPKAAKAPKAEKTAASAVKVFVEYQGKQMDVDAILEAVKAAAGVKRAKSLEVYVKPEDGAAYYVVNGKDSGKAAL